MKTGKQTIDLDGDKFTFKFQTKSALKGAGINGEDDDKYYLGGKLVTADKEDKFMIASIDSTGIGASWQRAGAGTCIYLFSVCKLHTGTPPDGGRKSLGSGVL